MGRWLINGALLTLLLSLGLLIRAELQQAQVIPTLTDMTAADLYRVEILRDGEPTITLTQTAIGWRLETPLQVDADNHHVSQLLGLLDAPVERSFPAQTVDLRELGLSPPKVRLRLDAHELHFGNTDPIGHGRYVASDGLVHLIQDRFQHRLIAPPIDFVSRQLLPRDFSPAFGRLGGIPLTPETLNDLARLHAERVEVLMTTPSGAPVALKANDGVTLRFLVSEDRRRWARLDQRLLYVLTEPPELTLDPNLSDPTPPEPTAPLDAPTEPLPAASGDAADPFTAPGSPTDVRMTDDPPVVRLTPDGREIPVTDADMDAEQDAAPSPIQLPGEPDKLAPSGFGQDPFAPDPTQ
ncbi:DUF4340 domain-containing protein [Allochromatium warmingii]|nr:DUF4340 domain-containing protein [Allochromatium warmingii]